MAPSARSPAISSPISVTPSPTFRRGRRRWSSSRVHAADGHVDRTASRPFDRRDHGDREGRQSGRRDRQLRGQSATNVSINGAGTSLTATAPAGSGTVDVTATVSSLTSGTSSADQFTYVPAPTVTSVSPPAGPLVGGITVTVSGTNLSGAAVGFGPNPATNIVVNGADTSLTATAPAGTGTVDVQVTTVGGASATSTKDQFTYEPPPTVSLINPTAGPVAAEPWSR